MLLAFDDMELVCEARRGDEAVSMCLEFEPDVILVDMKMPGMDGIQTTAALKQRCPEVRIVVLTSFHDPNLVRRAMRTGAIGYLLKDSSKEDVAAAIRSTSVGQTTISHEAVEDLLAAESNGCDIELTQREREVVSLLAQGMSNKEIGKHLNRSPYTIRHHVSQLIKKLNAANRAEVAAIAVEQGLIG